eukprot:2409973-Prymnesium_polylepis.1
MECTHVGGDLHVIGTELTNMSQLSRVQRIFGTLTIARNQGLVNLAGMETLQAVGALSVVRNAALQNLQGLSGLINVTTHIVVTEDNSNINDFRGPVSYTHLTLPTICSV